MALKASLKSNVATTNLKQTGISLLEFVLGLVLLSIILLGVTLFFAGQQRQLDPVFQFRAVSLAEAVAEQVIAVKYDINNNPFEQQRCVNTPTAPLPCLDKPSINASSEPPHDITTFTVVDDFNLWCDSAIKGRVLAEQLGLPQPELYQNFTVATCVNPSDGDEENPYYKEVSIKVSINSGANITFKLQRYNIL